MPICPPAPSYGANEWRDDLRKVLKKAGLEGKDTVFLFTDTQIVQENYLEDINNILNSGEVCILTASQLCHIEPSVPTPSTVLQWATALLVRAITGRKDPP